MPRIFIYLLLLPLFLGSSTLAAVSHIEVDCLTPFTVYLLFGFVICTFVCSVITVVICFIQCIDYICVRVAYFRHHPQYRNRDIAALLRLV